MIESHNLIKGSIVKGKEIHVNMSPLDRQISSQAGFFSHEQLIRVFKNIKKTKSSKTMIDYSELKKLANHFHEHKQIFTEQIMNDAGFIRKDAEDLVDSSIEFCTYYDKYFKQIFTKDISSQFSFNKDSKRKIEMRSIPYGLIAATTPRNTPLLTELTVIVHALWSGNTLILRPSPGVAGVVVLLIKSLQKSFKASTLSRFSIVFANAKDFINVSLNYSNLLHYIGSTKYLENTLVAGINKGVKVLVDGDGCSMVIVDKTADLEKAVLDCYNGLIRCNGQICISVRVIVVEQIVYKKFISLFLSHIQATKVMPPKYNNKSQMGPLFSSFQVENIMNVSKKYKLIKINANRLKFGQNYMNPVVVELGVKDKNFLKEKLFGPIVGISYFKGDGWKRWLKENPINLTDVLFSRNEKLINEFINTSKSPRKIINNDPTIESVFEPWGAFLPSGWNDVSHWFYKYRNYYQLVKD